MVHDQEDLAKKKQEYYKDSVSDSQRIWKQLKAHIEKDDESGALDLILSTLVQNKEKTDEDEFQIREVKRLTDEKKELEQELEKVKAHNEQELSQLLEENTALKQQMEEM